MNSNSRDIDPKSEINETADSLEEGDKVLFNDRAKPLEVTSRFEKEITKVHRRRAGVRNHYDIIVLAGNGTVYHLLWQHGSGVDPVLRKRSEWTEKETEGGETEYEYSAQGTRVDSIEIVTQAQQD